MSLAADVVFGLRRRLGLTQASLAELLGVSSMSVGRWERGEGAIPRTTAAVLVTLAREKAERREDMGTLLRDLAKDQAP